MDKFWLIVFASIATISAFFAAVVGMDGRFWLAAIYIFSAAAWLAGAIALLWLNQND